MFTPDAPTATLKDNANFRWLMRGGVVSSIGDQLTMVALPLTVLQVSGDPLALGAVLALMGIPRAVFLLLGGAMVDRLSPGAVLMATKLANALLLAMLTLLVLNTRPSLAWTVGPFGSIAVHLTPHLTLVLFDALAFCLGLAQAFSIPAGTAIMPNALPSTLLEGANGVLMGIRQLTVLVGPLLAAVLVGTSRHGLALAFALDSASYLVSAWTLARVTLNARVVSGAREPMLRAVGAGLRAVWIDAPMRWCFLYWGLVSFCIGGAMQVALPILASSTFHGGAALGLFMGTHGAGVLLGMAAATVGARRIRMTRFGSTILLMDGIAGLLVAPLGLAGHAWMVAALLLGLGALSGYLQITVFTWIQRRVPLEMMGRVMSIFMFILMGLAPLSALGAGALLTRMPVADLFLGGGLLLAVLAALAWLFTPMRGIVLSESSTAARTAG